MAHALTCIINDKAGSNNAAEAQALINRIAASTGVKHGCCFLQVGPSFLDWPSRLVPLAG
jgi:hypothetical protein